MFIPSRCHTIALKSEYIAHIASASMSLLLCWIGFWRTMIAGATVCCVAVTVVNQVTSTLLALYRTNGSGQKQKCNILVRLAYKTHIE